MGAFPGEIGPWAKAALGDAAVPAVLDDTDGLQFEKIAALQPDLILGLYSALTKDDYSKLSALAPTVAQPVGENDYGVSWDKETLIVGQAVGKAEEAQKIVDGIEAKFAEAKAAHPEFAGKTAIEAATYEGYWVYSASDARVHILTQLGFTLPDGLAEIVGDKFGANLSKERTDLLDTDVIVWLVPDPTSDPVTLHKDTLYARQDVVTEGREIFIGDNTEYGAAHSFVSPLSLPYVLDRLVPQLAAAVDGDPSTAVPQE
jgi:iron complex transport system substrate-binding protein